MENSRGIDLSQDIQTFRNEVVAESLREFGGDDLENGFAAVAGRMLEEAEEFVDFMACPYRGTGARRRNLGIDGYAIDEADGSFRMFIANFDGGAEPITVSQTSAKTEFSKLSGFIEEALAGNDDHLPADEDPATDFSAILHQHKDSISRFRLYLVTDGQLSDRIRDWPEAAIGGIPTEFHIWDISRFHAAQSSRSGREALTVNFAEIDEGGIPCLHASLNQSRYSGYLCVIPGETLARIYETYGSRLLEGNVRSFLGKTGKVNKAIRETSLRNPEMFFAFNNGISATATSVSIEKTAEGARLVKATDLQIVNGGQTTASLAFAKRRDGADLSSIFVQMKLSVVSEDLSGELIPKISEYSNKQNKVSDSDLFANHEYHRQLEALSRRIKAPPRAGSLRSTTWFYERAKGQYRIETANMSPAEKLRFEADNPKSQLLIKTDLAKIENSWLGLPHEVSKGAQKNFDAFSKRVVADWAARPLQFNDEYFRTVVSHAIVFRGLEHVIPKEDWYDGGFRAQVVTYSLAKLVRMLELQAPGKAINHQLIWKQQSMSPALEAQLKLIAGAMYEVITSPEQGRENVTEWCKMELAWQRAQEKRIELLPAFSAELVSAETNADIRRDAIGVARIDRGIAAITTVVQCKPSRWRQIRKWGIDNRHLSAKEDQLLTLAASGKVPSDKQAAAILAIQRRLEHEGLASDLEGMT
jgi:hypothetical protein